MVAFFRRKKTQLSHGDPVVNNHLPDTTVGLGGQTANPALPFTPSVGMDSHAAAGRNPLSSTEVGTDGSVPAAGSTPGFNSPAAAFSGEPGMTASTSTPITITDDGEVLSRRPELPADAAKTAFLGDIKPEPPVPADTAAAGTFRDSTGVNSTPPSAIETHSEAGRDPQDSSETNALSGVAGANLDGDTPGDTPPSVPSAIERHEAFNRDPESSTEVGTNGSIPPAGSVPGFTATASAFSGDPGMTAGASTDTHPTDQAINSAADAMHPAASASTAPEQPFDSSIATAARSIAAPAPSEPSAIESHLAAGRDPQSSDEVGANSLAAPAPHISTSYDVGGTMVNSASEPSAPAASAPAVPVTNNTSYDVGGTLTMPTPISAEQTPPAFSGFNPANDTGTVHGFGRTAE